MELSANRQQITEWRRAKGRISQRILGTDKRMVGEASWLPSSYERLRTSGKGSAARGANERISQRTLGTDRRMWATVVASLVPSMPKDEQEGALFAGGFVGEPSTWLHSRLSSAGAVTKNSL